MTSIKEKIIEIAYDIDNLSFPPITEEEVAEWKKLLEDLNFQLCELELQ